MPAKDDAADKEKCLERFLKLGLDERTAKNTIANHKVTTNLTAVIHERFPDVEVVALEDYGSVAEDEIDGAVDVAVPVELSERVDVESVLVAFEAAVVEDREIVCDCEEEEHRAMLSERAVELLALPDDDIPKLLLDIGCGSGLSGETLSENGHHWIGLDISRSMLNIAVEREVEGDLLLGDMGQGLGLRPGVIDGAISISAVQWLCNADKSTHNPRLRLKAFFTSLYRCLTNGARAVFQLYPENLDQRELILSAAMHAGFSGGIVVDYPHSTKRRKEFLCLTCGQRSINTSIPNGKVEDGESCSDDDNDDEDNRTVCISDRHRPKKKQKRNRSGKGREWILRKKEQMRRRGNVVPADTKYTGRKRKDRF